MKYEKMPQYTEIYSYPVPKTVSKEKMISVNKQMREIEKGIREKAKRESCCICNRHCTSFCHSHSIPRFVLKNIAEQSEVSAPRQADNLEPQKSTGVESAGVFFNICNDCDSKYFQAYEDETALSSDVSNKMLIAIALKNFLKMIYERSIEVEEERVYSALVGTPKIVISEGLSPAEYAVKSIDRELKYALKSLMSNGLEDYHLCFRKKLDYVVPYAAQYPIAMLMDLHGNVINNFYTGSSTYKLEYLHVAIFPLANSSIILIFAKNGEKRHRRFIRQLQKLDELDQLSAINYLTFTGADNVYINKTVYAKMTQNLIFLEACRMTYSIRSSVPNPPDALKVAMRKHDFRKRYALPNLLAPQYAINKEHEKGEEKK